MRHGRRTEQHGQAAALPAPDLGDPARPAAAVRSVAPPVDRARAQPDPGHGVSFRDATRAWATVALNSFGGPAGQIAVMHRVVVEERNWFSEARFLHALNYCMLLPGPEAQQLATYLGWLLHGVRGGLVAGGLFILPGFLAILALSVAYAAFGDVTVVEALFFGVKAAVMAIVASAVVRIGRRALASRALVAIAVASFVAIFFLDVAFPLIVLGAAATGYVLGRVRPGAVASRSAHQAAEVEQRAAPAVRDDLGADAQPGLRRALVVLGTGLVAWGGPVAALVLWLGGDSIYVQEARLFSTAAVITFGGAYSVLPYIAQQAVQAYGWLAPGEMLDGLGMAETTPGPLIQVVQFVGFMGAYRAAGGLDPIVAGIAGSVLTAWVTFVPCFVWIFLGAPYIERLRGNRHLSAALSAITAAVVGVVLNLAVWFSLHTLFGRVDEVRWSVLRLYRPQWQTVDPAAAGLAAVAMYLIFRRRWSVMRTLGVCACAGAALFVAQAA